MDSFKSIVGWSGYGAKLLCGSSLVLSMAAKE